MNSSAPRSFAFAASIASKIMMGKKNTSMAISSMHDNNRFSGRVPRINRRVPGTLASLIRLPRIFWLLLVVCRDYRPQTKSPDALYTHRGLSVGSMRQSLRSIADALTNHYVLTKPVNPVGDHSSALAIKIVTIVTGVPVRADVSAAGTDAKLQGVGRACRSRSQHDQRGEREDTSLHLAPPPLGQKRHNA